MAMKPLRPCRHPGCPELTREGYCPKHKPKRAERRVSAQWHGWYSLPIWTDDLRPAQLMREPFCRECARQYPPGDPRRRTRATVVDHIDLDRTFRLAARLDGAPEEILRPITAVKRMRRQREASAEQALHAEQVSSPSMASPTEQAL